MAGPLVRSTEAPREGRVTGASTGLETELFVALQYQDDEAEVVDPPLVSHAARKTACCSLINIYSPRCGLAVQKSHEPCQVFVGLVEKRAEKESGIEGRSTAPVLG